MAPNGAMTTLGISSTSGSKNTIGSGATKNGGTTGSGGTTWMVVQGHPLICEVHCLHLT